MIVRPNENRKTTVTNKTVKGFFISAYLQALAVNTLLLDTQHATSLGFDPSQINLNVTLKRGGKTFVQINNNLGILGQYCTLLQGAKEWLKGTDLVRPTVALKHQNFRGVFIDLGGFTHVKDTDELDIQITCGKNAFNADSLDVPACYLDVNPVYGIGKEFGIMHISSEIIQANSTRDNFNLGDNVLKIAMLNFENTDVTQQIIQTLAVASDRLDQTFSLPELILNHRGMFGKQPFDFPYDPAAGAGSALESYVSAYPQSFLVLNDQEIDRATVDMTFDGTKVNASKNALVYTYFLTSQEIIESARKMEAKHYNENMSKIPVSL